MANPFVQVELLTTDVARAKDFYPGLFDWKLGNIEGMDYTLIKVGVVKAGGEKMITVPDFRPPGIYLCRCPCPGAGALCS